MSNHQSSKKPRQFLAEARKIVEARLPGVTPDEETRKRVSEIVREAIGKNMTDVRQIIRSYPRWVDEPTRELVRAELLESTQTEDIEEIDVDAYRI